MQYQYNQTSEVNATYQAVDLGVHGYEVTTPQFLAWGIERYGLLNRMTLLQILFSLICVCNPMLFLFRVLISLDLLF